jgi:hypothetical protein
MTGTAQDHSPPDDTDSEWEPGYGGSWEEGKENQSEDHDGMSTKQWRGSVLQEAILKNKAQQDALAGMSPRFGSRHCCSTWQPAYMP